MRSLLWLYWRCHGPFLRAFARALIGRGRGDLDPDGRAIVAQLDTLLKEMPHPVFAQATAALYFLPLWVPASQPYAAWRRILLKLWAIFRSHLARIVFVFESDARRAARLDQMFARLNDQAGEEEDDLIKGIILLGAIKTLLTSAYLDLERTWRGLGYQPFTRRTWDPPSGPDLANPPETAAGRLLRAHVETPEAVAAKPPGQTTYLVIGSGAGGAVAAWSIQEHDPEARIVLVDGGPLATNDQYPRHLMTAAAELYMNGANTLSANQKYTFVQARCVGGGTILNNSVALKPTGFWWDEVIVERWSWLGAALDWPRLSRCYDEVMAAIHVGPIDTRVLTPMAETLRRGFAATGLTPDVVTCNLVECIGCGRCNAGCQYCAKQSMVETVIPRLVAVGGLLVPDCHVRELVLEGPRGSQVCRGARVRGAGGRTVTIEADKVVLAAGAYASTKILRRSGFAGAKPGVRTVGRRFSGNMGTPVFARFAEPQEAWRGQQVGYMMGLERERLVIETAFAPPPAFGLQAPQWGARFMEQVEAYGHLGVAVPVLGTSAYGDITYGLAPSGFVIDFRMNDEDWYRLAIGMKACAEAFLAMGAREVYSTRFDARVLQGPADPAEIAAYFAGTGPLQYLKVTTAHLQGGNVIHDNPQLGVVDRDMKVHGIERLWIADASVIPAPITLNVQLTVMALARYAAEGVVRG